MRYPPIDVLDESKKIQQLFSSDDVHVFEKLDGGNTQIAVPESHPITHGLRSGKVSGASKERKWVKQFERFFWGNRQRLQESLEPGFVYFMEFLGPHTVVYKPEFVNRAFLIDVWDLKNGVFVPYEDGAKKTEPVKDLVLPAPLLYRGRVDKKGIKRLLEEASPYAVDGIKEGLVLKDYKTGTFGKTYHPRHTPRN